MVLVVRRIAVLVTLAWVLTAAPVASAGPLDTCAQRVIRDWYSGGRVNGVYPLACYRAAIEALPDDVLEYSEADRDIARALAFARRGSAETATPTRARPAPAAGATGAEARPRPRRKSAAEATAPSPQAQHRRRRRRGSAGPAIERPRRRSLATRERAGADGRLRCRPVSGDRARGARRDAARDRCGGLGARAPSLTRHRPTNR